MCGKMIIFLGGRWELETLLCSRGGPSCVLAGGGSKGGQKQSCAWEVMYELLFLAGQRSRSCEERAGSLEGMGFCKAQPSEKWLLGSELRLGLGGRRAGQGWFGGKVWVGDSGTQSWIELSCWEQLSLCPSPGLSA